VNKQQAVSKVVNNGRLQWSS